MRARSAPRSCAPRMIHPPEDGMPHPWWEHRDWYDVHDNTSIAGPDREPEHYREFVITLPPIGPDDHVVDVGAGTGKLSGLARRRLPGRRADHADRAQREQARPRPEPPRRPPRSRARAPAARDAGRRRDVARRRGLARHRGQRPHARARRARRDAARRAALRGPGRWPRSGRSCGPGGWLFDLETWPCRGTWARRTAPSGGSHCSS